MQKIKDRSVVSRLAPQDKESNNKLNATATNIPRKENTRINGTRI